jgi:hypothetical protein
MFRRRKKKVTFVWKLGASHCALLVYICSCSYFSYPLFNHLNITLLLNCYCTRAPLPSTAALTKQ